MGQLLAQRRLDRLGQHHRPVLAALAVAHDEGAAAELDVLDPQLQALGDAQAGAVEQRGEQPVLARFDGGQDAADLVDAQHHRQAARLTRPADLLHPRQVLAQHLVVEEQQGRQRLAVRGRGHLALGGQPTEKGLDLGPGHVGRVPQLVEADEGPHPVHIGILGARAVVQVADAFTELIQHLGRLQGRQGLAAAFHGGSQS